MRADRPPTNVIARDRLVSCLLALATELGVRVTHGVDVSSVQWEGDGEVVLTCAPCGEACQIEGAAGGAAAGAFELRAPFLVASDGARRTVAEAAAAEDAALPWWRAPPGSRFRIRKYADASVRVYKTVPFRPPADWRGDINYSARTVAANFDALVRRRP